MNIQVKKDNFVTNYLTNCHNKYINSILLNKNKIEIYKIYEMLNAIENNSILWGDVPTKIIHKYEIPYHQDRGIDAININESLEITESYQYKCYQKTKNITQTDCFNFIGYSNLFDIIKKILITYPNVKYDKVIGKSLKKMIL